MKRISFAHPVLIAGGTVALYALCRHVLPGTGVGPLKLAWSAASDGQTLVFAALTAFFFSSLALAPRLRTAVAQVALSIMAVLYGVEVVMATTALGPQGNVPFWLIERSSPQTKKAIATAAARAGVTVDTRARAELLDDSRRQGIEIVPAVMLADVLDDNVAASSKPASADDLLPLGGISSIRTLLCNQGQVVSYASDEHGFRNPSGIWNSRRADIAVVGQSSPQGYCVRDGKIFVDLLRTHNQVVLNLGNSGQSSLLQLAAIKEYLPRYKPKTVLWIFTEGIDLPDLYVESTHPLSRRYLDPAFSQHLLQRQPEIDTALRQLVSRSEARESGPSSDARRGSLAERALPILKLWNLRQKVDLAYGPDIDPQAWSTLEPASGGLLRNTLAEARSVVSAWSGTLYFVYLPGWNRYRNGPRTADQEHAKVLSLVSALAIPIIDVQPAFQEHNDPLSLFPFRRFGHYNERGNQIVADTIVRALSLP